MKKQNDESRKQKRVISPYWILKFRLLFPVYCLLVLRYNQPESPSLETAMSHSQPLVLPADDHAQLVQLTARYPMHVTMPKHITSISVLDALTTIGQVRPSLATLLLERGAIWLGSKRLENAAQHEIKAGDTLVIHTPPNAEFVDLTFTADSILYEDRWLAVINKPAGWFTIENPWDTQANVEVAFDHFLTKRDGRHAAIHLVHRLDRDTSGALIISKTPEANAAFQRMFNANLVNKTYVAWCTGIIDQNKQDVLTGHGRGKNGLWQVYSLNMVGKPHGPKQRVIRDARTTFTVQRRTDGATLVEAYLHTGRTHQIRLHAKYIGHPVVGDERYGGLMQIGDVPITHHLLHAAHLEFPHPIMRKQLTIEAPPPDLWDKLK